MKILLVLISLGCLLNGATLLQDTVSALVDETASLIIEVKVLKDKIKTLESNNLDGKNSLIVETIFTKTTKRVVNKDDHLKNDTFNNLKTIDKESNITTEHLTSPIKNGVVEVSNINTNNSKRLEFGDVMIFVWHANIRKTPSKESSIMGIYDIGSLHSVEITYVNDNWFKLSNGYYLSKKVAQTIDKNLYTEVITIDNKNNLRNFPVAKKEYLKSVLQKNTILFVYPKKVADIWYVTQEHEFIYDKLVKNNE